MRNAFLVTANTLRVTFRARSKILVYFVLPVLGVLLSLFINFGDTRQSARIGVVDLDGGRFARDLVRNIGEWGGYATTPMIEDDMDRRIAKGDLDAGIVIPAGFGDGVLAGSVPKIRLVSLKGDMVTAWLEEIIDLHVTGLSDLTAASEGDGDTFERMYAGIQDGGARLAVEKLPDVSAGKRVTVASLGFLVYFLMLGAGITMQLVLAERRNRTYFRIRTAPVRAGEYIVGNGLAGFAIVIAQVVAVLALMKYAFRIETYVPDLLLLGILLTFGVTAVGSAMAITAFSRSSAVANVLMNLILTPTCMIAGCFWPASLMPTFLQRIALFLPQRWVLDAVQNAQTGAGWGAVGADILVIGAFALALLLVAGYRFSRIEESGQFV